jgi:hypothetical protein
MKVKYPLTPELYKQYKRRKTISTIEVINVETGVTNNTIKSETFEYMKVCDKINGKLFVNNIPTNSMCDLPYLVNEANEILRFEPLKDEKGWIDIIPYADGWLVRLENINDYIVGEYYYIMEIEK